MSLNKQELSRLIKDISNTKKSIERAQTTIETKRSVLDTQLRNAEIELGITSDTLIEIGRIAVKRFGYTISPEKFSEELNFIFSDSIIAEYVAGEMESLPFAEQLTELYKALKGKADKAAKGESENAATDENTEEADENSVADNKAT